MARKVRLSGEIGFDISAAAVLQQLDAAAGEDLEIDIASIGGSVFDGIEIYNGIQDYARQYPAAKITVRIEGVAASMASYIATVPVAVRVVAEANSVLMLHHPWNLSVGDYREMQRNADFLKGLSDLLAKSYQARAKKSAREVASWMDQETWLFGSEIKDAGFADEMLGAPAPAEQKGQAVARARLAFAKLRGDLKGLQADPERVAAVIRTVAASAGARSDGQPDPVVDEAGAKLREALAEAALSDELRDLAKVEPWTPGGVKYDPSDVVDLRSDDVIEI